jgi:hypothetical protein
MELAERLELVEAELRAIKVLLRGHEERGFSFLPSFLGGGSRKDNDDAEREKEDDTPPNESDLRIEACVDEFLKSEKGIATHAKKMLYREMLKLVFYFATHGLSTASVRFYGHEMRFSLRPMDNPDEIFVASKE